MSKNKNKNEKKFNSIDKVTASIIRTNIYKIDDKNNDTGSIFNEG